LFDRMTMTPRSLITSWRYYASSAIAREILFGRGITPTGLQRHTSLCRAATRRRFCSTHCRSLYFDGNLRIVPGSPIRRNR
jgi:hypothetical protein